MHKIELMSLCVAMLAVVTGVHGLQFSMDRSPSSAYCGHLQCWADKFFIDTYAFSIIGLAVYDITNPQISVKIASLELFDQNLHVDQNKVNVVNASGHISNKHADLTLAFLHDTDCVNGSFSCELDFVSDDSEPQVIRETVSPGRNGNCPIAFNQIAKMAMEVKARSDDVEAELAETKKELNEQNISLSTDLKEVRQQNTAFKTELDEWFYHLLNPQVICMKGKPHNSTRDKFLLWGKVPALCDTETDGGGWIIIQRRVTGNVDFYRSWDEYKKGFGTPDTDFWIGNDIIYSLTSQGYTELRVDMIYQGKPISAQYSSFSIADEASDYRLSVSGYNGTGGDGLGGHNNLKFSTYDRDNDNATYSCAILHHGAWWYLSCYASNLNGLWGAQNDTGMIWLWFSGKSPVTFSEMKIRLI